MNKQDPLNEESDFLINIDESKFDNDYNLELMFQIEDENPISVMRTNGCSITFKFSGGDSIEYTIPDGRKFKLSTIKTKNND